MIMINFKVKKFMDLHVPVVVWCYVTPQFISYQRKIDFAFFYVVQLLTCV